MHTPTPPGHQLDTTTCTLTLRAYPLLELISLLSTLLEQAPGLHETIHDLQIAELGDPVICKDPHIQELARLTIDLIQSQKDKGYQDPHYRTPLIHLLETLTGSLVSIVKTNADTTRNGVRVRVKLTLEPLPNL